MEEIELKLGDKEGQGMFAISLVNSPAMEADIVMLSDEIELKLADESKNTVVGVVMIPEKRIKRNINGNMVNIFFSAETVEKTAELYMKNLHLKDVTVDHQTKVDDVSTIELWIVEDEKMDKSNLFNLNASKGSLVVKMKVDNPIVMQDIKDGKYKGYSLEGRFSGAEHLMAIQETDAERIIRELKELLSKDDK